MKHLLTSLLLGFLALHSVAVGAAATTEAETTWRSQLARADELARTGDSQGAIALYSQAIRLRLDDPDTWLARARAYVTLGRYRDAIDDYDQVAKLIPDKFQAYLERGYAYGQAGDYQRATEDMTRALRLQPRNVRALTLRAAALAKLNRLKEAIADFSGAISLAAPDAQLFLARGSLYAALSEHKLALADRDEAVRLRPDSAEALIARGGSYHALGIHPRGIADRTEAIRLNPTMAEAWCARGSAYFLLGELEHATEDLQHALELKADYVEARLVLEKLALDKAEQQLAEAKAAAEPVEPVIIASSTVPADDPTAAATSTRPDVLADHSESRIAQNESHVAAKPVQPESGIPGTVKQTDPSSQPVQLLALAKPRITSKPEVAPAPAPTAMLAAPKQPPAAPAGVVTAPRVTPVQVTPVQGTPVQGNPAQVSPVQPAPGNVKSAAVHNQRGRDLINQSRYKDAVDELTAALHDQPNLTLAWNARGFAYLLLRDYPSALADLDEAIRLDPKYPNAYRNRAVTRRASGDAAGAASDDAMVRDLTAAN